MVGNIIGTYQLLEKIGEGGMGEVYKGVDIMLEREVAIKMLRPELARQPEVVARFRSEAVTLAKLNHLNLAAVYNFLRQGDGFFMVMEFVPGETLEKMILQKGPLFCTESIQILSQALEGISQAHRAGIIHRDIKPANVMVTPGGTVKVMDFGIARVLSSMSRMTREGAVIGTIEYMSPEQICGDQIDQRSDIYSLGILLYELLAGRTPFGSHSEYELLRAQVELPPPPPRSVVANLPVEVEQVLLRALEKRPEDRFQTVDDFRLALCRTLESDSPVHPVETGNEAGVANAGREIKETKIWESSPVTLLSRFKPTRFAGSVLAGNPQPDAPLHTESPANQSLFFRRFSRRQLVAALAALLLATAGSIAFSGIVFQRAAQADTDAVIEPADAAKSEPALSPVVPSPEVTGVIKQTDASEVKEALSSPLEKQSLSDASQPIGSSDEIRKPRKARRRVGDQGLERQLQRLEDALDGKNR